MKILIVNHHPQDVVGGSQIQSDLIATYLTRFGHQVVYFAVQGQQPRYETSYAVECDSLTQGGLERALRKHQPEIVYWRFNRRKLLPSVLTCKRLNVKFVFSISSGDDLVKWLPRVKLAGIPLRETLSRVSHLLRHIFVMRAQYFSYYFVDGVIAQLDQQLWKLPVRRQVAIHNSVDPTAAPFHWEKPFVLWIGSFKAVKNPGIFIELARQFQGTGVDFLMVGEMRERHAMTASAPDRPANLHCLGVRPYFEVNGMLQQALCLVQTSDIEGFPNVMIQAWAQGKPTIGLYYDPDQMITTHKLGYLSGNFAQLVQDTQQLIENAALREEMGQRAKAFANTHFHPEHNIRQFEAFFREVCRHEGTKTRREIRR